VENVKLGKSRKYYTGATHENASGKFQILDRYLGDDEKPWLKFQWLSGDKEGEIEENKEENINASLYKFRVSRGMQVVGDGYTESGDPPVTLKDIHDKVENIGQRIAVFEERHQAGRDRIKKYEDMMKHQQDVIDDIMKRVEENHRLVKARISDFDLLLQKVDENNNTMQELLGYKELMGKLIDKM
jgi:uncharacterized coiled-coil protein SlyX